jgi:putative nucleotidyltransferase with HDIG domain
MSNPQDKQPAAGFFEYIFKRAKSSRDGRFTRILVAILFTLMIGIFWPVSDTLEYPYQVDQKWQHSDLIAQRTFPIYKSVSELEKEREQIRKSVPEPFSASGDLAEINRKKIIDYFQILTISAQQIRTERNDLKLKEIDTELQKLQPPITREQLQKLNQNNTDLNILRMLTINIYEDIFRYGLLDKSLKDIHTPMIALRRSAYRQVIRDKNTVFDKARATDLINRETLKLPDESAQLVRQILFLYCQPNFKFREDIYAEMMEHATDRVLPYRGKVEKGELIVANGQIVTTDIARKLESYFKEASGYQKKQSNRHFLRILAQIILVGLMTLTIAFYLNSYRRSIYLDTKKFTLIFFVLMLSVLMLIALEFLARNTSTSLRMDLIYLTPLCLGPLLITIYFDDRIGFLSNIVLAMVAGWMAQNSLEVFFVQFCAGTFAVINMTEVPERSQLISTAGVVLVCYSMAYLAFQFYRTGNIFEINYANLILFAFNALFILSIYPIVMLFGRLFNLTSELTYLDLLNLEHPLLVEMAQKAPGTYQHSLQVAYISEELARTIRANPLQAYVGALFHDIGKTANPTYFTENQIPGQSAHDKLTPLQSAEIIIAHVTDGADIARQYRLPLAVIQFIMTHHGTTRVEYFYLQYVQQMGGEVTEREERLFRYPGPLPRSKEEAIVMIADTVEAAARSLEQPTHEDIRALVENLILYKQKDDQFRESSLTFEELNKIKYALIKLMQSIHHTRIKYPDLKPKDE